MVKLINALTGGEMWVHETRVDEYLDRGHKIADEGIAAMVTGNVSKSKNAPPAKKSTKKKG